MALGTDGLFEPRNVTPEEEEAVKRQSLIDALLRERRGWVARGREDNISAVDKELERLGFTRADARKGRERATKKAPEQS